MGKNVFYLLPMFVLFFISCNSPKEENNQNTDSSAISAINKPNPYLKLQIYYFHATQRCPTCNSIEANIKQVLETNYKGQIASGLIDFKSLCVDDKANKALVEKYEATGAALHLLKIENGKESDFDLTEFAFMHSRNEPDFFLQSMKDTISYFIR
jgi:hypothetical protein